MLTKFITQDPEPSLKFYREIMGMRKLFSYNAGSFSIYCELLCATFCDIGSLICLREKICTTVTLTLRRFGLISTTRKASWSVSLGPCSLLWACVLKRSLSFAVIHRHGTELDPDFSYCSGNEEPHMGFGHLGFVVDDVPGLVKRVEEAGELSITRSRDVVEFLKLQLSPYAAR